MKRKFYDKAPEIFEADQRDFRQEISFIAKLLGVSDSRIEIAADHPCGEDLIFIDGRYNGYLDTDFYNYMIDGIDPYGDYADWLINFQENY